MFRLSSPLLTCTLLAAIAAAVALPARADPPDRGQGREARDDRREPPRYRGDALSDSVRRIQRERGGQVLSAERMQSDGRDINRIKLVDDRGRVRVYMDDPQQGGRRGPPPTRDDDD